MSELQQGDGQQANQTALRGCRIFSFERGESCGSFKAPAAPSAPPTRPLHAGQRRTIFGAASLRILPATCFCHFANRHFCNDLSVFLDDSLGGYACVRLSRSSPTGASNELPAVTITARSTKFSFPAILPGQSRAISPSLRPWEPLRPSLHLL